MYGRDGADPRPAFLLLHFACFALLLAAARSFWGWRGIAATLLLWLFSPLLWYTNKVHTEFFLFCLSACGLLWAARRRMAEAALALSLCAAQNPSFSPAALIALAGWLGGRPWRSRQPWAWLCAGAASVALALHPCYYFTGHGTLSPQLLTGSAALRWPAAGQLLDLFFNPDIGLLPNWPLGALLAVAAAAVRRGRSLPPGGFALAGGVLFLSLLVGQSFSRYPYGGGGVFITRYAIWFLPLWLPAVERLLGSPARPVARLGLAALLLPLAVHSAVRYWPSRSEAFDRPSPAAAFLAARRPDLYHPPRKLFELRYSGRGETIWSVPRWAVADERCRRILVYRESALPAGPGPLPKPVGCRRPLDVERLRARLAAMKGRSEPDGEGIYFDLTAAELADLVPPLQPGRPLEPAAPGGDAYLGGGWSPPEGWGVWSDGPQASLSFRLERWPAEATIQLVATAYTAGGPQEVTFLFNGESLRTVVFSDRRSLRVSLPVPVPLRRRDNELLVRVARPVSPRELGRSADARKLGLGLQSLELTAAP